VKSKWPPTLNSQSIWLKILTWKKLVGRTPKLEARLTRILSAQKLPSDLGLLWRKRTVGGSMSTACVCWPLLDVLSMSPVEWQCRLTASPSWTTYSTQWKSSQVIHTRLHTLSMAGHLQSTDQLLRLLLVQFGRNCKGSVEGYQTVALDNQRD